MDDSTNRPGPWATLRMVDNLGRPGDIARYGERLAGAGINAAAVWHEFEALLDYRYLPELHLPESAERQAARAVVSAEIAALGKLGIGAFIAMKSYAFPRQLLDLHPRARGEGCALCSSSDEAAALVAAQVRELVEVFPQASGLQILTSEAMSDPFTCQCPRCADVPRSDLFVRFARIVGEAAGGKTVIIVPYLSGWRTVKEPEWFGSTGERLPDNVLVRVNAMWSDQFFPHPGHPLLDLLPPEHLLVDFDLWGEYWGWGEIPCCLADYLAERVAYCRARGIRSYLGRLRWMFPECVFDGLNEVNFDAFTRLLGEDAPDADDLVARWAAKRFGESAAARLAPLWPLTRGAVEGMMFANGLAINSHSHPPESLVRWRYLMNDFSAPFYPDGRERAAMTPKNWELMRREKTRMVETCAEMLRVVESARETLAPDDYRLLELTFQGAIETARVWQQLTDAVLGYEEYAREASPLRQAPLRGAILSAIAAGERQCWRARRCDPGYAMSIFNELRYLLQTPVVPWGGFVPTGGPTALGEQDSSVREPTGVSASDSHT